MKKYFYLIVPILLVVFTHASKAATLALPVGYYIYDPSTNCAPYVTCTKEVSLKMITYIMPSVYVDYSNNQAKLYPSISASNNITEAYCIGLQDAACYPNLLATIGNIKFLTSNGQTYADGSSYPYSDVQIGNNYTISMPYTWDSSVSIDLTSSNSQTYYFSVPMTIKYIAPNLLFNVGFSDPATPGSNTTLKVTGCDSMRLGFYGGQKFCQNDISLTGSFYVQAKNNTPPSIFVK